MNKAEVTPDIEVPLHEFAHPSDFLAEFLIRRYGGEKYGASAKPAGPRVVLVGRGGYDEHDPANLPDPEVLECEATLAARDLGVRDLPELQSLLTYILMADRRGKGKGLLQFARVAERLNAVYPDQPWRVKRFAEVMFEATIEYEASRSNGIAPLVSTEVVGYLIGRAYTKAAGEYQLAARLRLEDVIRHWFKAEELDIKPFGFADCIRLLWLKFGRFRWGEHSVVNWAADAFRAELKWQEEYLAARRECDQLAEDGQIDEVAMTVRGKGVIAYLVRSDSPRVHSYLLSRDFSTSSEVGVVAVRRSNGNVQIFPRRARLLVRLNLEFVIAFLRDRERGKRGHREPATWAELTAAQGPRGGECWFFYLPPQWIFNGAKSAEVEPTLLSDSELLRCIERGLDDACAEFRRQFRRRHSSESVRK